ncbi:MAG: VCBS repeat-containing protein [Planctomycetes bacterium]|nr:VCBS repeat-containing protein [Planctomycetota bacterium]
MRLNEDGSFGEPTSIGLERGATSSVALGDLDLDGDPDLVTGDGRDADRVWINVGGSFADSGQRLGRGATSDVLLADIDQDGALDLVTAGRGGGNRFWLNDRAGTFVDSRQLLGTAVTAALALGDVDGDGDLDFVAGNEDGANQVWLQSLAGAWGSTTLVPSQLPATPSSSENREIATVDLDRDGDVDLVLAGGASGGSSVWRGDGSGLFTLVQGLSPAVNSNAIAVGDMDGDGDADLVESLNKNNPPAPLDDRVWLNDGTGLFVLSTELKFTNSHSPLDVALVDLDANGELDYVYTDATGSRGMAVWLSHEGEFTDSGQSLGSGNTKALAIGDVDSNGLVDFVESFENLIFARRGRILLNGIAGKPAGFFSDGQSLELSQSAQALGLALGDLDDDGDLDLVSTDKDGGGSHAWFNQDGTGNFEEGQQRLADPQETAFQTVALADLDGDGALDVVTGGSGSRHASFRNEGDGTFALGIAVDSSGSDARGCAAADVDRDGDVDILMALFSGAAEVWFNR